jgi:putative transcriptional regulator
MRVREGAALRRRRLERGLSQRELAFLARPCSQTTIYLLETQRLRNVNDHLAARIARRLDVPVSSLFDVGMEANTEASARPGPD